MYGQMEIDVNNTGEDLEAHLIKMTGDRTALKMTKQLLAPTHSSEIRWRLSHLPRAVWVMADTSYMVSVLYIHKDY